jgi:hypothetical protein
VESTGGGLDFGGNCGIIAGMHRLCQWIANYWKLLVSSGVVAAIGTFILKGPEIIEGWSRTYRRVRGTQATPFVAPVEDFVTDFIPRFGFKFAAPKGWDRTDPENSDGSCYRNPIDPMVTVLAYGQNPVIEPTDFDEWVEASLRGPHVRLLSKVESGRFLAPPPRSLRG